MQNRNGLMIIALRRLDLIYKNTCQPFDDLYQFKETKGALRECYPKNVFAAVCAKNMI